MIKKKLVTHDGRMAILTAQSVWSRGPNDSKEPEDGDVVPHYDKVLKVEILTQRDGAYDVVEVDVEYLRSVLDAVDQSHRVEELMTYSSLPF